MRRAAAVLMVLVAVGCSSQGVTATGGAGSSTADEPLPPITATEAGAPVVDFGRITVPIESPDGGQRHVFRTYDAADAESRARGLMFIPQLEDDVGMIFRFPTESAGGFWMKDVVVPLSVAFADAEGQITDILDMEPCAQEPCEIYTPSHSYLYAFEVRKGVFGDKKIEPGWRLVVPQGLDPPQ